MFPTRSLHFHICFTGSNRCGCVGLAFPNVDYVINFSFQCTAKDYAAQLNHAGRTARKGIVHTFFTPAYQVGHLNSSCTRLGCRRLNVKRMNVESQVRRWMWSLHCRHELKSWSKFWLKQVRLCLMSCRRWSVLPTKRQELGVEEMSYAKSCCLDLFWILLFLCSDLKRNEIEGM